jgi:hypothetical protein
MSLPRVALVQACDDPDLLGFPLWPRQRDLLAEVEAGPRLQVWALGRRSGKTTMAALVALHACLFRPDLDALVRPGERRYAVAVATNLRQARLFVRAALSIVEASPLLAEMIATVTEDEIMFVGGQTLAAFPCSSRGARGWPISTLLMDEAAFMISDTEGPAVAERVFASLAPSTAQFGDAARIVVASTPYGQDGLFATLYAQAAEGELEDAAAHTATSASVNPTITPDFLAREQKRDPESYRGEYLAEFVGSGHAFLDPQKIEDAISDRGEIDPLTGLGWVAGLDPAFSSDPFGLAIVGRDPNQPSRLVLGVARHWKPSGRKATSFEERREIEDAVLREVADECSRYNARVVTDQFCAPAVVDRLRDAGLSVAAEAMTATTKTAAFSELRARLNAGTLDLYEAPGLVPELRRLRTRYTAGAASVVNPRVGGSHGDMAQALALAVWAHDRGGTSWGQAARVGGDDLGIRSSLSGWGEERLGYDATL